MFRVSTDDRIPEHKHKPFLRQSKRIETLKRRLHGMFSVKGIILLALLIQNCSVVMLTRHIRVRERPEGFPLFSVTSVVVAAELVKFITCFIWALGTLVPRRGDGLLDEPTTEFAKRARNYTTDLLAVLVRPHAFVLLFVRTISHVFIRSDALHMIIPAALFTLQNNILYVALENIEVSTFQILYQSKLILTAVAVTIVFKKKYNTSQWLSLGLLFLGVVLTQLDEGAKKGGNAMVSSGDHAKGLIAVIVATVSSATASVVMEKLLKSGATSSSLPARNVQLAVYSLIITMSLHIHNESSQLLSSRATEAVSRHISAMFQPPVPILSSNESSKSNDTNVADEAPAVTAESIKKSTTRPPSPHPDDSPKHFFSGFDSLVWATVFMQAIGGIIVSLVLKYADNVLKCCAVSLAIVACGLISILAFDMQPTAYFVSGAVLVIASVFGFNLLGPV